ncbi:MAG: class IV adenylate cyclase [Halobacteriales archaeon]|nr:class IV adenylate cyclase [Halobacteriales archaeon]
MIEVEVKVRASHDEVEESLDALGAERVTQKTQNDTYFTAPHRDFAQTDEALRVRREDGEAFVTYKGPKLDNETKTREEHETRVGSGEEARAVFESLGFEEFGTVRKHRRVYELDGATVTLDDVEGLGEFVEVELEAEGDAETEEARVRILETLELLGLDPDASVRDSYLELLYAD